MTREENIRAILECNFSGFKDEIIDIAVKNIMSLSQEPIDALQKIRGGDMLFGDEVEQALKMAIKTLESEVKR